MSRVGSLLVAGRSAGGAWCEVSDCGGAELRDLTQRGTAVTAAGGVPRLASLTGRSLAAAPAAQQPGGLAHAARTVLFHRMAESRDFAVACTQLGRVYFAGHGASGAPQEGGSRAAPGSSTAGAGSPPVLVPSIEGVVAVAAGEAHCVALRADGCVFAWGRNDAGQLGLGATSEAGRRSSGAGDSTGAGAVPGASRFQGVPRFLASLHRQRIASIACGARHTLLVGEDGSLFACGEGVAGQLGVGRCTSIHVPLRVHFEPTRPSRELAAQVRAMGSIGEAQHAAAAADEEGGAGADASHDGSELPDGETFGGSSVGEHKDGKEDGGRGGHASASASSEVPADDSDVVAGFDAAAVDVRVAQVVGGFGHSLALTRSGHVFSFGLNSYGQLGLGDLRSRFVPALVFEVARETEGLSLQGIGSDDDTAGDVEAYARAGHVLRPLLAQQVAAGPFHSAFLAPARLGGGVFTCGSSADGRLGQAHMDAPAGGTVAHVSIMSQLQALELGSEEGGAAASAAEGGDAASVLVPPSAPGPGAPQHPDFRWAFPSGIGPLSAPEPAPGPAPRGGPSAPAPFAPPPHYERNLARGPFGMRPERADTFDPVFERPMLPAVRAGTWSVPLLRTHAHREMRSQGQRFALAVAAGIVKPSLDPQSHRAHVESVLERIESGEIGSAALASVNPRAAPRVRGKPWLRMPRQQKADANLTVPTLLRAAVLDGRVVTHVQCAEAETLLFCPAILGRAVPHACADFGGTLVTLSGKGLNSIAKVPEATLGAALAVAESDAAAEEAVRTYAPRKDATGMLAIAGVYVRWTGRFDKSTAGMSREVRPAVHPVEVRYSRAYYAVGADLSGFRGMSEMPFPFRARLDGTPFPASADTVELDLDSIRTVAPAMSRPCEAAVEVVVLDAARGEAGLLDHAPDAVAHGAVRFCFFTQPVLLSAAPAVVAPANHEEVTLAGDNFFGCALVDVTARPVAEALVAEVQRDVAAREAAEALRLTSELTAMDAKKRKGGAAAAAAAAAAAGAKAPPPQLLKVRHTAGSTEEPCEVLVTFDVIVDGVKLGRSEPVHGHYELAYDEHIVDVRAASHAVATATTGLRLPSGTAAPVTTPLATDRPSAPLRAASSAGLGGGAAAAAASASVDEGKDEDAEGIVGTYSASVRVHVPDLSALVTTSCLPPVPEGLTETVDLLYAQVRAHSESKDDEAAAVAAAESALSAIDVQKLKAARSLKYESQLSGVGRPLPKTTLVPRLSTNGGVDWLENKAVALQCRRPELSHLSPPAMLLSEGEHAAPNVAFLVRGTGFVAGAACEVSLVRVGPDGAALTAPIQCKAVVKDETTLAVTALRKSVRALLPDAVLPPLEEPAEGAAAEDGAAAAPAAEAAAEGEDRGLEVLRKPPPLCGFFSLEASVRLGGRAVPAVARPLRLVVCLGGVQEPALTASGKLPAPAFVSSGGTHFSFALSTPNAPPGSCFDCVSHLPSDALSWTPPALSVGSLLTGLKARGGAAAHGGDGSGAGDNSYGILLMDAAGHTHQIGARLTSGGWVHGEFKPFGLRLAPGPLRAAVTVDGDPRHALATVAKFCVFAPEELVVGAVTSAAKKVCAGAEIKVEVQGLADLLALCEGATPAPGDVLVRLTCGEAAPETAPAVLAADGSGVTFVCPELVGSIVVELSLTKGVEASWTAPGAAPIVTVKK